jgi:signal-transduction protein with cAMP-binding, CBS, and nucleotidyltransferase domain
MKAWINLMKRYVKLSKEAEQAFLNELKRESYKKNAFLIPAGQVCSKVWFINEGMVRRGFFHDDEDITVWMYWENDIVTALNSFTTRTPALEFIQAQEDVEVFSISYQVTERLFTAYPEIREFSRLHQQEKLFCWDSFCQRFPLMDAQQKYEYLSEVAPQIIKRAKLSHVASIMHVTQETLSRVRARTFST